MVSENLGSCGGKRNCSFTTIIGLFGTPVRIALPTPTLLSPTAHFACIRVRNHLRLGRHELRRIPNQACFVKGFIRRDVVLPRCLLTNCHDGSSREDLLVPIPLPA